MVVLDTETTGLSADSYIVEIGAVKLQGKRMINTFSQIIRPPIPIPQQVVKIHGINDDKVRNAPSFAEIADRFLNFIGDAILVAHNAPFDLKILTYNLLRVGKSLPNNPVLDTCRALKNLFPNLPSYSLRYLAKHFRSPYREFHRALSDAAHTAYVFLHAVEKCGVREESLVDELLEIFGPPIYFHHFKNMYNPKEPEGVLDYIIRAIETGSQLDILYENGRELKRRVIPLNLFSNQRRWYLRATCLIDNKEKYFRVDRIKKLRIVEACVG